MQINVSFDQALSSLPSGFVAAVDYVVALYDRMFTNNISVNIDVGYGEIGPDDSSLGGSLGESYTYETGFSYSQVRTAVAADKGSNGLTTAISDLPATDPTDGGEFFIANAEAAALGLIQSSGSIAGYVGFSSTADFNYSTTNPSVSGKTDFVGVVEHEFSEVLGRISEIGDGSYSLLDMYRYSASGVHDLSAASGPNSNLLNYFSVNNGATNLGDFNTYDNGDYGDWGSENGQTGAAGNPDNSFNAFSSSGVANIFSLTDLKVMQSLGYVASADFLWPDDFNANATSDLLLENTSGVVVVGQDVNGAESYTQVSALGPEWSFKGNGDFLGDGGQDFLIENASGVVDIGEVKNGATTYTEAAALGSEWKFVEAGDFLANGQDQFLIENNNGAVVVGNVVAGQAQYTQVSLLGPEWSFVGEGDLLGDGKTGFLIENTSGAVDVGEVANGAASFTPVAVLGKEWSFKGVGDFLGNGQDQFLIENTSGVVELGNVVDGAAQYTGIATLGAEWSFIGTGDYLGNGTIGFMIENTAGAMALGTVAQGQASFTQVGALGSEWKSHS